MLRHRHHKAVEPEFGHYHHKAEEDLSVCRRRHKAGTKSEEEEGGGLAYSLGIDLFLSHGSVLSLILYPSQTAKFRLHFPVSTHYS